MTTWRDLTDAERERELSPSSCIGGNYQPFMAAYADRSFQARLATPGRLNLRYGAGDAHRLDLFVPTGSGPSSPPPLLVFIHGGYWQELSKQDSSFAATDAVAEGVALAVLDYTLAPAATVAAMVGECRCALTWLVDHATELGFDARRIVVAGSSAGGHLAAIAALPAPGVPPVQGAVLVSGVFDLEPLVGTSINQALGLDAASARAISPAWQPSAALRGFPPSIVCWGEVETSEFKRQSRDFAALLANGGTRCQTFEVPRRNHFDVVLDLAKPGTLLGATTLALIRSL